MLPRIQRNLDFHVSSLVGFRCMFSLYIFSPVCDPRVCRDSSWIVMTLLPCSFGWSSNFQVCWQTRCPSCWYCTLDEFFRVTRSLTRHFSALVTLGNALGGTQWDLLVCSYQSAVVMWIQLWWEITTWTGISPAFLSASHFWNFGYKNAVLY